jgi:Flp pilus assembly protein protease CpaA
MHRPVSYQFFKEEAVMGAIVLLLVFILLVAVGVVTSVRLYTQGVMGAGRFKIRRVRTIKTSPDGRVIEDTTTTEEISEEEEPVEEAEG